MATVLVLSAVASVLSGCGGSRPKPPPATAVPAIGGTVTVGIDQAPTGCNPNTASGNTAADRLVLSLVLPSAFIVDEQGQATYDPALIEQAELHSTSPETVVYTINPKAEWSDGVPITAADFTYAWEHQRSVPLGLIGGDADVASTAGYDDISTMTSSDHGRTLTVVFSTPYADWESLFSDLLPAHVLEQTGWSPPCSTVNPAIDLSGGPYMISAVSPNRITLVRNPRWWGQQPRLAKIVIRVADGPLQLAHWLSDGRIDVAAPTFFTPAFLQEVASIPGVKSAMSISDTFVELEFATASGITADPLIRDAIAYALDRQALVDKVASWADVAIAPATSHLFAQGQPSYPTTPAPVPANSTTTTTSPGMSTTTAPISASTFPASGDVTLFTRNFEEAGYEKSANGVWTNAAGTPLVMRLAVDGGDGWAAAAAEVVASQLRAQGIGVSVASAPSDQAAGSSLATGQADLAVLALHGGPFPTQTSAWYTPLLDVPGSTGSQDWSGYVSTKVEELFTEAAHKLNPVSAAPIYSEIDRLLWSDMVGLPLFSEPDVLAWSASLSGVTPGPYWPGLFATVVEWALLVKEPVTFTGTPTLPGAHVRGP